MAYGAIIAALLGTGSQVAGGVMGSQGGVSPGSIISNNYDPTLDSALQAAKFDAMNQIGFGNVNQLAGPFASLVNRVNSTAVDAKTKRRALKYLLNQQRIATGQEPDIRKTPTKPGLGYESDEVYTPDAFIGRWRQVAQQIGMTDADLPAIFAQEAEFKAQQKRLSDAGLGRLNEETILNRAGAAASASRLLGEAGRYATGGEASGFQNSLLDRLNRGINDQEEALMLRAQFGGFNPAAGLEGIQRMRQDSSITALTQAVQAAAALTSGLSGGNAVAQGAAGLGTNASIQSLGLAAQQANAANQLAQQSSINRADSLANGIAGGGNALSQAALLMYMNRNSPSYSSNDTGSEWNW